MSGPEKVFRDGGKRETFTSGAVREPSLVEGRYDLISPFFLQRLAVVMAKGTLKYAPADQWEKGMPVCTFYDHLMKHLALFKQGDESEDHLGAAAFNLMALIHTMILHPHLDDRRRYPNATSSIPLTPLGEAPELIKKLDWDQRDKVLDAIIAKSKKESDEILNRTPPAPAPGQVSIEEYGQERIYVGTGPAPTSRLGGPPPDSGDPEFLPCPRGTGRGD